MAGDVKVLIWEDEPMASTRAALEARGVTIAVFAPTALPPETGDLVSRLSAGADALEAAAAAVADAADGSGDAAPEGSGEGSGE